MYTLADEGSLDITGIEADDLIVLLNGEQVVLFDCNDLSFC